MTSNKTSTYQQFERGSIILGFQAVVSEVFGGTPATGLLRLGFTNQPCFSTLTGFPTTDLATLGHAFGPSATGLTSSYTITAVSDTFDGLSNTKTLTSGKLDIHVLHVPPPNGNAPTTFKTYYAT